MDEPRFTPEMTVEAALALHPKAKWVLAAWQLGACTSCAVSSEETLAQVAEGYRLPLEKLMGDLNGLLRSAAAEPPL